MSDSFLVPRAFRRRSFDPSRWLAPFYLSACNRVGAGARTIGRPLVHNEGRIFIGRDTTLRSVPSPIRLTAVAPGAISIGDGVLVDEGATLFSQVEVRIEDAAVIGPGVVICDSDEEGRSGRVVIGRSARLEAGARVVGPSQLGPGAIVHAGAVVRGAVPAGAVVRAKHDNGPPARTDPTAPAVAKREARAVLVADFTVDELAEHLRVADLDGLVIHAEIAAFDQVAPTLMKLSSEEPKADLAVVWTRPERVSTGFRDLLVGGPAELDRIFAEVDAFAALLRANALAARHVFVPSWVLPPAHRGLGLLELRRPGPTNVLARMNLRLAAAVEAIPNTFVLDAQRWLAVAGDGGFEPKLWYAGKVAFTTEVLAEAARDIQSGLRGALGMSRKLVVVDLDDTMWGGIVGDVGWEHLNLGGHDPNGEAFVEFQRQLIALTRHGIALAVVSKNEESTALTAMRRHPEMQIKPEMLAAYRINWRDKARNIVEIAEELRLGLQSVVFLDDSPVERARVREALPEVYVPEWPADPTQYPGTLGSLRCFDASHISTEDIERNAMYATERQRSSLRSEVSSLEEWLATLDVRVRFERIGSTNVSRAAQLLNKTNQMNLSTRRMSEAELLQWANEAGNEAWAVYVSDRFGPAGLTGLLGLARTDDEVRLADYVLSCRVMGRRVEETLVWAAKKRAGALGGLKLVVSPKPTAKNKPCIDFFARAGLRVSSNGYVEPLASNEPPPSLVTIEGLQ
jgi:FkbH-like protein